MKPQDDLDNTAVRAKIAGAFLLNIGAVAFYGAFSAVFSEVFKYDLFVVLSLVPFLIVLALLFFIINQKSRNSGVMLVVFSLFYIILFKAVVDLSFSYALKETPVDICFFMIVFYLDLAFMGVRQLYARSSRFFIIAFILITAITLGLGFCGPYSPNFWVTKWMFDLLNLKG